MAIETGVAVGVALLAFVFAYIGINLKDDHAPLKWMFLIFSVMTAVFDTFAMGLLAKDAGKDAVGSVLNNGYFYGTIVIMIILIVYFLLFYVIKVLGKLGKSAYGQRQ